MQALHLDFSFRLFPIHPWFLKRIRWVVSSSLPLYSSVSNMDGRTSSSAISWIKSCALFRSSGVPRRRYS